MELIKEAEEVIIVDFSYKRPIMERICDTAKAVVVLDHHKTAMDDLMPLFKTGKINKGQFDMSRCGSMMAWDFYHSRPTRPKLLVEIDKQDRWLPDRNAELIMALRSYPHKPQEDTKEAFTSLMRHWSWLMTDEGFAALRRDGVAIHRYYRQRVEETKPHAAPMTIGRFRDVPVVNAPYSLASDVAGELAETAPDGIGAVWWQNRDGSITFSLRSRGDVDVGLLASEYGGGGHPGAAGFKINSLGDL